MNFKRPIYLASDSPRRKKLLQKLVGNDFKIIEHGHIERNETKISSQKQAMKHAAAKTRSAIKKLSRGIVIGADTIVVCKRKMLGKPGNKKNAEKMLKLISGNKVEVITAVAVIDVENKRSFKHIEKTKVKIKKLNNRIIKGYVRTKEPLDKAGAFAIQGKGRALIEKIEGDYSNVVGLPISKLKKIFKKLGIKTLL